MPSFEIFATACGRSAVLRDSPPRRCCRSPSASARTPPSSASRARCCCDRCRIQSADRLAILWNRSPGLGIAEDWFSTAQYFDITTRHHGFDALAIAIGANYNLTGDGEPERIGTIRVSSNLLPMLGARPALGRLFGPEDDVPGRTGTAVLSHGTWLQTLRRRSVGRRADADAERPALRDRRRAGRVVLAAARGHADARRRRERGDPAAAAAGRRRRTDPQPRGLQHHRQAEARGPPDRRAGGDGHAHRAAAARASRFLPAERRPDVQHRAAPGAGRRRRAASRCWSSRRPWGSCC